MGSGDRGVLVRPEPEPRAAGTAVPAPPSRSAVVAAGVVLAAVWVAAGAFRLLHPAPDALDLRWDAIAGAAPGSVLHLVATVCAVTGAGVPAIAVALVVAVGVATARGRVWAAFVLGASLISEVDVLALKALAMRTRPDSAFGAATAFPSGHTANAALLGTVVVLLARRVVVRVLAVAGMIAMAWSRTAIHAHWLTDVVAGLALGVASAVLLLALFLPALRRVRRAGAVRS